MLVPLGTLVALLIAAGSCSPSPQNASPATPPTAAGDGWTATFEHTGLGRAVVPVVRIDSPTADRCAQPAACLAPAFRAAGDNVELLLKDDRDPIKRARFAQAVAMASGILEFPSP